MRRQANFFRTGHDGNRHNLTRGKRGRAATVRNDLAEWVGREILPHERHARSWLRRRVASEADVNDIVQECYCRIANLRDISHIEQPRAYFFSIIRNLLQERLRAARVVRIEAFADLDFEPESDSPSPERVIAARLELGRVHEALGQLTERARRIFILRKIEGMSQREIARVLDVTEAVVENDASRGLRLVLKALTQPDARLPSASAIREGNHVRSR